MVYCFWFSVAQHYGGLYDMLEINLLPWRAILKEKNNKIKNFLFLYIFILIFLFFSITSLLNFILEIDTENSNNLKNQLAELTNQTQKEAVNPSALITHQIYSNQTELIGFFKSLIQNTPNGISWLTLISQKNGITATGNADSIAVLTRFVNAYNLKKNILFMNITGITHASNSINSIDSIEFKLHLTRSACPLPIQTETHDAI